MSSDDDRRLRAHVPHMYGVRGFVRPTFGPYVNRSFWGSNYNINPHAEFVPQKSHPNATLPLEKGRKVFEIKDQIWPPSSADSSKQEKTLLTFNKSSHGKTVTSKNEKAGDKRATRNRKSVTNWRALASSVQKTEYRGKASGQYEPHLLRQRKIWYLEALPEDVYAAKNKEFSTVGESSTQSSVRESGKRTEPNAKQPPKQGNSGSPKLFAGRIPRTKTWKAGPHDEEDDERLYFPRLFPDKWRIIDVTGNVQRCLEIGENGSPCLVSHGTQSNFSLLLPNLDV